MKFNWLINRHNAGLAPLIRATVFRNIRFPVPDLMMIAFSLTCAGNALNFDPGTVSALTHTIFLRSDNGNFSLTVSAGGDVALRNVNSSETVWAISPGRRVRTRFCLMENGTLCLEAEKGGAVFWTSPSPPPGTFVPRQLSAILSNQGTLDLIAGGKDLIWSTGTAGNAAAPRAGLCLIETTTPEGAIGILHLQDDESGTFTPYGDQPGVDVLVYRKAGSASGAATLYLSGRASERMDVMLDYASPMRFHVIKVQV
ncbi:MAG: hypothetical protein HC779_02200 [Phyllobacteriaceae bacterium]|nr:hypothetical protein [Phyllobacteriaceae bacterium]